MTLKLYRVTCRGMTTTVGGNVAHGLAYVVAEDAADAYRRVRTELDKTDLGFSKDREMDKVELLAEEGMYPDCGHRLYA